MKELLEKVIKGEALDTYEIEAVFSSMAEGKLGPALSAAFLVAMRARGEKPEELEALVRVMLKKAVKVPIDRRPLVDVVGTGGDGMHTLNVSTLSALLMASFGLKVAKHGNRAISSSCGSADLLEGLGFKIDAPKDMMVQSLLQTGFGFFFAPLYHPCMANVQPIRRELGIRTLFNFLGPLINPTDPELMLIGAPSVEGAWMMARALKGLGKKAFVVHGLDGLDEVSPEADTLLLEVSPDGVLERRISPEDFGLKRVPTAFLRVEGSEGALRRARAILEGSEDPGRNAVIMEAALGLKLCGLVQDLKEGATMCEEALRSKKGLEVLEKAKEVLNRA